MPNRLLTRDEVELEIIEPLTKAFNTLFADILGENPDAKIATTYDVNGFPKIVVMQV